MPALDFKHIAVLLAYAVLTAVLNLIFSKRSQIDEWCEANPRLAAFAKLLRGVGIDPWTIAQSLVLAFTSKLPGYQKQSLSELQAKKPKGPDVPPPLDVVGVLFVICCFASGFAVTSCALFSPADYAHCLPQPADLLSNVASILKNPDYEKQLKDLAVVKTEAAVLCAVRQFIDSLNGKIGASPEDAVSVARGKAFLAKAGAK